MNLLILLSHLIRYVLIFLSLQSGCDETLRRMNRRYTTKDYKEAVELLRANIKDIAFTTDIIVGFPGESEEEFNKSYQFVEEIAFSQIHVFKYSPRNGTPAAKMKSQIAPEIKKKEAERMIQLANVYKINFKSADRKNYGSII